jgi:hypothetical protein
MRASILSSLGLLAGLAACAATTTNSSVNTGYTVDALRYAASKGYLLTEVRGNPFTVPQPAFAEAVTRAMYGHHHGPDVPFVTTAPPQSSSPYRVVLVFDPAAVVDAHELCLGAASPVEPPRPGAVRLVAAFCEPDGALTWVHASGPPASGPDDPAFQALIAQVTNELFPPTSPNLGGNDWNDS